MKQIKFLKEYYLPFLINWLQIAKNFFCLLPNLLQVLSLTAKEYQTLPILHLAVILF